MNTKQLFSMILALLLCCGLSVPAAAESRTTSVEPKFWFRQDFDGLETVNQSSSGDALFSAAGGSAPGRGIPRGCCRGAGHSQLFRP